MEYSPAAWERAMRRQDVILRAISGEISWFAAADILQMTPRNLRRWRERYERWGYNGLVDQRRCPSKRRVPLAELERVLRLFRERYAGFNRDAAIEVLSTTHLGASTATNKDGRVTAPLRLDSLQLPE